MRVKRSGVLIRAREERGAVLMIVAICLFVVLGMLVLTFDLGRGVAIKRNMVAGTDAAAIAAARECAIGQPMGSAEGAAQMLLTRNNEAATMTDFQADPSQCSGNPDVLQNQTSLVTVKSTVDQEYFFAQIFGFTSGSVVASATAEWGPAVGVSNPVPLRLNGAQTDGCLAQPVGYEGEECAFGFDNDDPAGSSYWGVMNFPEGWPVAPGPNPVDCAGNQGGQSEVIDYLSGLGDEFSPVLWALPEPVYVCADAGLGASTISWMVDWFNSQEDNTLIFPVMADLEVWPTVDNNGLAYPIIGFIKMTVVGAWKGNEARQHCEFARRNSSQFCIQLRRTDTEIVDGIPGNGAFYDQLKAIRLVD